MKISPANYIILRIAVIGLALWSIASCARIQSMQSNSVPQEVTEGANLLLAGDRPGAQARFTKSVATSNLDTCLAIVAFCQMRKEWPLAAAYSVTTLARFPTADPEKRVFLLMCIATADLNMGDSKKAIQFAEDALKVMPDHYSTLNGTGYMYAEVYDPDRPGEMIKLLTAVKMIDQALAKAREANLPDTEMGAIVDSQGWVQYRLKNYKDAVANLSRAVSLAPDQSEIQYHLGMALAKMDQKDQALVALDRAIKLDPGFKAAIAAREELKVPTAVDLKPNIPAPGK
ncbi:MAG: tetratricopeptide repeat protein [Chthonomonadales bacterium]